ncbi:MAG: ATP-dependent protease ATPase subunit HslU [Alicyclobacillaceae bacterium]|nr:ATP-dependent protease ATPase subunit HslU [Alicyclobacillaceae bacterium]
MEEAQWTPKQIVEELDKYIIGQKEAKRAVAVALRNRYRRNRLPEDMREEVLPKNILMIGPTGVGKTELARRLAKLVRAPFVKVEATKFTEVGYVGRDVDSMVRDLVETAIRMVRQERMAEVEARARQAAEERLITILAQGGERPKGFRNPFEVFFGQGQDSGEQAESSPEAHGRREEIARQLAEGVLDDQLIEIEVEDTNFPFLDMGTSGQFEEMGVQLQDLLGQFLPRRKRRRKVTVREARHILTQQEAQKLIDMDEVQAEAVRRAEQSGIIFIDEIDKIAGKDRYGPDVSREGVQRDILPIVEGSTVMTKYGPVKTDHILFIAAGAFHMSKPSDLIPELQGRFPIRIELHSLTAEDFKRILTEPRHALIKQYTALLETEGVRVVFTDAAVERIAELAAAVNQQTEDIGARRLNTLMEKLMEDLFFEAPDIFLDKIEITPEYVDQKLASIAGDRDLSQYIL